MRLSIEQMSACILFSAVSLLWLPDFLLLTWQMTAVACLILLILLFVCYVSGKRQCTRFLILILCLLFNLGYMHAPAHQLLSQADKVILLPKKVKIDFKIIEILHQTDYQTFIVSAQLQKGETEQRIYLQWRTKEKVQLGEVWHGELSLKPISSRLNFSGFDKQQWYLANRITARASVKSAVKLTQHFSWRNQLLKESLKQTEGLDYQGLLIALAFGERAWLPQQIWQIYQKTNTAHLIAISGLHIGLAMSIGYWIVRCVQILLPLRWIIPHLPMLSGLLLAYIYGQLAGFAIPTSRACIALFVIISCRLLRVSYNAWQLLLIVTAILLLFDPLMILSLSFWLSISAVTCLVLWYQVFPFSLLQWQGKSISISPWHKVEWIIRIFHLQIGLLWLFTPIQLLLFNGFSLSSFYANLIALPIYSLVLVPLVLFATFTQGAFSSWPIANEIAQKVTLILQTWQDNWHFVSQTETAFIITALTVLFIIAVRSVYDVKKVDKTRRNLYCLNKPYFGFHFTAEPTLFCSLKRSIYCIATLIVTSCLGYPIYQSFFASQWRLDMLDVGQGLAVLITKNGRGILYDTGSAWRSGSMAQLEIVPYLQRQGISLEHVIISHDDNDHAGGTKTILQQYPKTTLTTASRQNYGKTDRTFCLSGQKWYWQGLNIIVLSPHHIVTRAKNMDSCVLLISDGYNNVLLTGDADVASENQFVSQLDKIDVLQVGHHGSKTSTGYALLQKTRPKIALISSGRWNQWKFPHKQVIQRLTQYQCQIYNTAETGQISLLFNKKQITIQRARTEFSPWYRRLIGLQKK
ncbi:DNA internalization-related competence protein ComEC/Rec2 [Pasteurella canis]|uniref:DNA internalization-related competence protein ComEC/Rec2 n=1 Tax=Pasteurella canis TaxID=753 RepID=UPI001CC5C476|nr:DNA internalization-related competence protein ComEC/Rec2 [Pasteurella canis]UAY78527.1 DNA internalization-related competence protein ComEC/Rec2 [Pasteurella canis]